METIEKFIEMSGKRAEIEKEMVKIGKDALKEGMQQLFAKDPGFKSFRWKQYAPSFNDGDPCDFSAHVDDYAIEINGINEDGNDENDEPVELTDEEEKKNTARAKAASKLLTNFPESILRELFGESNQITVHSDGKTEVDDYDPGY